jgi:hypothetical protein
LGCLAGFVQAGHRPGLRSAFCACAGLKDERVKAEELYAGNGVAPPSAGSDGVDRKQLVADVAAALYASKARLGPTLMAIADRLALRGWAQQALQIRRCVQWPAAFEAPSCAPPPTGVQLRAGLQHHPRQEHGAGLGHRPGQPGAHLEGGLHHPCRWAATLRISTFRRLSVTLLLWVRLVIHLVPAC